MVRRPRQCVFGFLSAVVYGAYKEEFPPLSTALLPSIEHPMQMPWFFSPLLSSVPLGPSSVFVLLLMLSCHKNIAMTRSCRFTVLQIRQGQSWQVLIVPIYFILKPTGPWSPDNVLHCCKWGRDSQPGCCGVPGSVRTFRRANMIPEIKPRVFK